MWAAYEVEMRRVPDASQVGLDRREIPFFMKLGNIIQ